MPSRIKNYVGRYYKKRRHRDKLSKRQRSNLMSKIRSKNTGLEKTFLRILRKFTNLKFKTNVKTIRGTPDFVFEKKRLCVFIDGDFWHGWQFPRWKHQMKNDYWKNKIEENRKRDRRVIKILRNQGWKVLRLWEHQVYDDTKACIEKTKVLLRHP